ncbi:AMP-binding protein [Desulfosarcina ovata]|uniref:Acetate--CoA ligase n=1 Tax=Desulfosarcina ovata subsp. ovata TaxID=2752305 RepID=A0A5K8ADE3_9BACT|nr:AMP-binding protein [Desulfosarcina ovata]BBO90597.1 acetate--CoA ligase [Desulfosarcina ovata subsp. ovata]
MITRFKRRNNDGPNGQPIPTDENVNSGWAEWQSIRNELESAAPGCGLNMAYVAVTRHANGPHKDHPALCCLSGESPRQTWTFSDLERFTNQAANVFRNLGIGPGQVVATLCGRVPELYLTALGALKAGAVFTALYASYGPEPILHRLVASQAVVLITTRRQYSKIQALRSRLPDLSHVLLIDPPDKPDPGVMHLPALMDAAAEDFHLSPTDPETPALIHFTSGTTGMPKGVVHAHAAALHQLLTGRTVLDLKPDDRYWCTADPGWVTGVVYGFLVPLMAGITTIVDEAEFDVRRWLRILAEERITVWYTAPSALRRLMTLPSKPCREFDLGALRHVFSVGEPLHATAVRWGEDALGVPIRDTWWQSETGGIMIANHPDQPVRPGAMGRPVRGIRAAVVRPAAAGGPTVEICGIGETGELALAAGWPSMFRRLLGDTGAYGRRFAGPWYLSGDLVRCDVEGLFWFLGRADDMIKTAGHMVSPFEVESVLLEYPGVSDAGVVGVPDMHLGQRVRAYLCLATDIPADENLRGRIMAFARKRLGPALAPREIVFIETMPKNQAGKILRRELAKGRP